MVRKTQLLLLGSTILFAWPATQDAFAADLTGFETAGTNGPVPARAPEGDDDDSPYFEGEEEEIETEDIFGFVEGGSTDEAGELEIEEGVVIRDGRRGAEEEEGGEDDAEAGEDGGPEGAVPIDYTAVEAESEIEYSLTDRLKLGAGFSIVYFDTFFPGEFNNDGVNFGGLSAEAKYRFVEARDDRPFNLAVAAEGEWERYSDESGDQLDGYGLTVGLLGDVALVPEKLFAAANLTFSTEIAEAEPEEDDDWEKESALGVSAALSYQVFDDIFVGGEASFENAFEGAFLDDRTGYAIYAGPTAYIAIADNTFIKGAWSTQLHGDADLDPGSDLNLIDFERNRYLISASIGF